jgi:hypothetical protein
VACPQPTQGTPKNKIKGKSIGCFFAWIVLLALACFIFLLFWRPLARANSKAANENYAK